jgi:hypothetical protein
MNLVKLVNPARSTAQTLAPIARHLATYTLVRIFLLRPKTNIRQENAAEYSADYKYSAQSRKHQKNVNLYMENKLFS